MLLHCRSHVPHILTAMSVSSKLPLSTIQGALAHNLATGMPLPTPLSAGAISSPLYLSQPFTNDIFQSFSTSFRHATHLKYRALVDTEKSRLKLSSLLGKSMCSSSSEGSLLPSAAVSGLCVVHQWRHPTPSRTPCSPASAPQCPHHQQNAMSHHPA